MARARTMVIAAPRPRTPNVNITLPRGGGFGRRLARRAGSAIAGQAMQRKHTLAALGAAAALGYMSRTGTTLPHIEAIGVPGTYALAAYALGEMTKSRTLSHMATGLGAIAVYDMVRTSSMLGSGGGMPGGSSMRGVIG
jgi:hypothetical protein